MCAAVPADSSAPPRARFRSVAPFYDGRGGERVWSAEVRASAKPFCEPWYPGAWRAHENIRQLCSQSVSNCSQTVCLAFTHKMAQKQRHEISLRSYWADFRDEF